MKFEALLDMLEEKVPALVRGKTLFINQMPYDIALGVLMRDSAGMQIDGDIPALRRGRFQVVSRGKDYAATNQLINEVMDALTITSVEFEGIIVYSIRPLHEPIAYSLSVGDNYEFSVNFSAIYGIVAV